MEKYLLDTNICIYIMKRKPARVLERFRHLDPQQVGISSITLSELTYGVEKSVMKEKNFDILANFIAMIEVLPYDENPTLAYGKLRSDLEKRGVPIGPLDMLIAAHALSLQRVLVTNNEGEFRRIPELHVENWAV
jgi:tRNA(fMet)-specific endonuclease VapC